MGNPNLSVGAEENLQDGSLGKIGYLSRFQKAVAEVTEMAREKLEAMGNLSLSAMERVEAALDYVFASGSETIKSAIKGMEKPVRAAVLAALVGVAAVPSMPHTVLAAEKGAPKLAKVKPAAPIKEPKKEFKPVKGSRAVAGENSGAPATSQGGNVGGKESSVDGHLPNGTPPKIVQSNQGDPNSRIASNSRNNSALETSSSGSAAFLGKEMKFVSPTLTRLEKKGGLSIGGRKEGAPNVQEVTSHIQTYVLDTRTVQVTSTQTMSGAEMYFLMPRGPFPTPGTTIEGTATSARNYPADVDDLASGFNHLQFVRVKLGSVQAGRTYSTVVDTSARCINPASFNISISDADSKQLDFWRVEACKAGADVAHPCNEMSKKFVELAGGGAILSGMVWGDDWHEHAVYGHPKTHYFVDPALPDIPKGPIHPKFIPDTIGSNVALPQGLPEQLLKGLVKQNAADGRGNLVLNGRTFFFGTNFNIDESPDEGPDGRPNKGPKVGYKRAVSENLPNREQLPFGHFEYLKSLEAPKLAAVPK